jgi:hypothetical protein
LLAETSIVKASARTLSARIIACQVKKRNIQPESTAIAFLIKICTRERPKSLSKAFSQQKTRAQPKGALKSIPKAYYEDQRRFGHAGYS